MFHLLIFLSLVFIPQLANAEEPWINQMQRQYGTPRDSNPPSDPVDDAMGGAIMQLFLEAAKQQYGNSSQRPVAAPNNSEAEYRQRIINRVQDFLVSYHNEMTENMEGIAIFYADYVAYGSKGVVSRDDIMAEKMEVERICPMRKYELDFENARMRPSPGKRDHFDVYIQVETYCSGPRTRTVRRWENYMTLDLSEPAILIVSTRGNVLSASR